MPSFLALCGIRPDHATVLSCCMIILQWRSVGVICARQRPWGANRGAPQTAHKRRHLPHTTPIWLTRVRTLIRPVTSTNATIALSYRLPPIQLRWSWLDPPQRRLFDLSTCRRTFIHSDRAHGVFAAHSALPAQVMPTGRGKKTGISERCGEKVKIIASVELFRQ
jgi:hypothetical protein